MRAVVGLVLVAGCASDPTSFDLAIGGAPAFVAERIDDGAWTRLGVASLESDVSIYHPERGDLIELMAACQYADGFGATTLRTTRDELELSLAFWSVSCNKTLLEPTIMVSGNATAHAGPTHISEGHFETLADTMSGAYVLRVRPETNDLVITNHLRMAILRDRDLHADASEPAIDLETEAALAMGAVDVDPSDPDESMSGTYTLITRGGTVAFWTTPPGQPRLVPSELLIDGDEQHVGIDANDGDGGSRTFDGQIGPDFPDRVALLPRLGSVTLDASGLVTTWSPFAADYRSMRLYCGNDHDGASVVQSRGWARAHDEGSTRFDIDVPGWDPAWIIPVAAGDCTFDVRSAPRPGQNYTTSYAF